jgi:hypothetical protein
MKALSIRQPWAWAVVNGYKPVENRARDIAHGYRGPLLIHAGQDLVTELDDALTAMAIAMRAAGDDPDDIPAMHSLPRGGFVGSATLIGVVNGRAARDAPVGNAGVTYALAAARRSPWFSGPVGLVLADAHPMTLVPWPGQLGLFEANVDPDAVGLPPNPAQQALPL